MSNFATLLVYIISSGLHFQHVNVYPKFISLKLKKIYMLFKKLIFCEKWPTNVFFFQFETFYQVTSYGKISPLRFFSKKTIYPDTLAKFRVDMITLTISKNKIYLLV